MCCVLRGRRGFTRQPENSKQTPPKFHERTPKRERKNILAEEGKSAKFWTPPPSGPHPSGPTLLGPTLRGLPFRTPQFGAHPPPTRWLKAALAQTGQAQTGQYLYWPKQINLAQSNTGLKRPEQVKRAGLKRFGLNRSLPFCRSGQREASLEICS